MLSGFQLQVESNIVCYWAVRSLYLKTLIRCTHVLLTIRENTEIFIQSGVKQITRIWHCCQLFLRLTLVICFPAFETVAKFAAFDTGYMFLHVWHWLHVSPRLKQLPSLPHLTLFTCYTPLKLSPSLPRFTLVTCFSAVDTAFDAGYMFPRVWNCSQVYRVWQWLHVSPRLKQFPSLPRLILVCTSFLPHLKLLPSLPRLTLVACLPRLKLSPAVKMLLVALCYIKR